MIIDSSYFKLVVELILLVIILGFPLFKILKNVLRMRAPKKKIIRIHLDNKDQEENAKLWKDLFKKDWGFKVIEGDLDGAPDISIFLEFKQSITKKIQTGLKQIFTEWYKKGFKEINKEGSEFGGLMHFTYDPVFKNNYAYFGFDLGTVMPQPAFADLLQKVSEWNENKIVKLVFGNYEEISNILFPPR